MGLHKGYCLVNHSESPNTKRGGEENLEVFSTTDIQEGEEITENYYALPDNHNPFYNNLEEMIFHCQIDAKNAR